MMAGRCDKYSHTACGGGSLSVWRAGCGGVYCAQSANAFWGVAMEVLEFWLRLWRHRLLPLGTFAAHINSLAGAGRRERGKPIQPAGGILFQLAHMLPRLVKGFCEKKTANSWNCLRFRGREAGNARRPSDHGVSPGVSWQACRVSWHRIGQSDSRERCA